MEEEEEHDQLGEIENGQEVEKLKTGEPLLMGNLESMCEGGVAQFKLRITTLSSQRSGSSRRRRRSASMMQKRISSYGSIGPNEQQVPLGQVGLLSSSTVEVWHNDCQFPAVFLRCIATK